MHHQLVETDVYLSPAQVKKLANGHAVQLHANQLHHSEPHTKHHKIHLHHETHKKLARAHHARKGVRFSMSKHEVEHSGSLWDTIKTGFNKYVKPVLSTVGDVVANSLSYTNPELAPVFQGVRQGVKDLTGVGIHHTRKAHLVKGSVEAKERMAAIRSMKKHKSGSFRL